MVRDLPIWGFTATLALSAAGLWLYLVRDLDGLDSTYRVPWLVVTLSHTLAETTAVHVQWFRSDTHSFSLSEIPLVVGFYVLEPGEVIAAVLIGSLVALLSRRQSPTKMAFNMGQFALGATAASALFFVVADTGNALSPQGILAVFAAVALNGAISVMAITTVISLSERTPRFSNVPDLLRFNLGANLVNSSIGVITVVMLWRSPSTTWVLVIPSALVVIAYRAYTQIRQRQERTELLFETTQILQGTPALSGAVVDLLDRAREVFNSDVAELILLNDRGEAFCTRLGPDDHTEALVPMQFDTTKSPWAEVIATPGVHVQLPHDPRRRLEGIVGDIAVKDAMAMALKGEEGIVGVIAIVNRLDETTAYTAEDRRLLEALAGQVTGVWEKRGLEESVSEFRQVEVQLSYQAQHDPLTGLANRTLFTDKVMAALTASSEGRSSLAVMFIDLDDFKQVNDRLGHAAGDQLLITVADRIRSCIRSTDTAARIGGDEFAVLLEGPERLQDGAGIAGRILATLKLEVPIQGAMVAPAASVGVAAPSEPGISREQLLNDADTAMYAAKAKGKGIVAVFELSIRAGERERLRVLEELRTALIESQFVLHYQPIVDLPSGQIAGVEALLRWRHPRLGLLDPSAFMDLAEDAGMFVPIGVHALRMACAQSRQWQDTGRAGGLTVGINMSASQIEHAGLLNDVTGALQETGCDPRSLIIEVGEATLQHASPSGLNTLLNLKQIGVRLAIDDYGSGYSSLSYLTKLPVDVIKIAKPFIDGLSRGAEDVALAKAIIRLGQALGREVIAVGIESDEQRGALQTLGCTLGQGFLYSGAVPADSLEGFMIAGFVPSTGAMLR